MLGTRQISEPATIKIFTLKLTLSSKTCRLAEKNKAPNDVLDILDLIPEKEYISPAHVIKEVGKKE